MSMVSNVGGNSIYDVSAAGAGTMSPDALLAYCQMQLGSIDDATQSQIEGQQLQLQQRTAVQSAENILQGYGTSGPSTLGDYNKCDAAFTQAIASLPAGDPVAEQLTKQQSAFENYYGQGQVLLPPLTNGQPLPTANDSSPLIHQASSADWQGITGTLSTLADNIKSDSEIQMLQLQDLVSERQQAVEQMTGMMTKEDQTLEDGAKAIGQ